MARVLHHVIEALINNSIANQNKLTQAKLWLHNLFILGFSLNYHNYYQSHYEFQYARQLPW